MLQTADNLDILINSLHCWVKDYYNDETKIFRKSGNYDLNKTNSTLSKTINITAYDGNTLIGCLRILSDGYYFGTITELLVLPKYQKQGVGSKLLQLAKDNTPLYYILEPNQEQKHFMKKMVVKKVYNLILL